MGEQPTRRQGPLEGDGFTVADGYLVAVAGCDQYLRVNIKPLTNLSALLARVLARTAVHEAVKAEGLLK